MRYTAHVHKWVFPLVGTSLGGIECPMGFASAPHPRENTGELQFPTSKSLAELFFRGSGCPIIFQLVIR
jgi:hypothetical protein